MNTMESALDAHVAMQYSILNWDKLHIATGGTLKPDRCFYHLISFSWSTSGKWSYGAHHDDKPASMFAQMSYYGNVYQI